MRIRLRHFGLLLIVAIGLTGCAAGRAYRDGERASRAGDLDAAVSAYRKALQKAPEDPKNRIALERAMRAASQAHIQRARDFEQKGQLEPAVSEYRLAAELDATNRFASVKASELERRVREMIEAARPKPAIQAMRERARAASAEPILNPASRDPLNIRFTNASLRDVLNFIANATGINISYDREVSDRPTTIQLDGITLEQALSQIMTMNQLSYKILSERSLFVFPDTAPKHAQYDEQVVRTFYISNVDATELTQILSSVLRLPQMAVQPAIAANKTSNTITIRATSPVMQILEKVIEQNDKPRAEIVVDVEILEVDRQRTKTYGLNLSEYALGAVFSPQVSPSGSSTTTTSTGGTTTTAAIKTGPSQVTSPPATNLSGFNLSTISRDLYFAIPAAIVKFLETDTNSKLIAKPQLRGAEGTKLTLKLGDQVPIISTSFTPLATGGAGVNPLNSYQYKDVGVNIDMTPRVTLEGDIMLDLTVDSSSRQPDVSVNGVSVPSFGQRTVTTRLRLRDGEPNLLAGLLREDERRSLTGFPGVMHVPLLSQLFSANDRSVTQTDIVMLLTPHIVRTQEITENDLKPIYIGSAGNLGLGGPPPLIAAPVQETPLTRSAPAPAAGRSAPAARPQGGAPIVAPPGSSLVPGVPGVPGTVVLPAPTPPAAGPPPAAAPPPAAPPPPPVDPAPGPATPSVAAPPPADGPASSPGMGSAQLIISAPATPLKVGGGPYLVPLSITGASRISTMTLTLVFDPAKLRVRTVQEGSFMRSGGVNVTFIQNVSGNRVDITMTRAADATGASGTGLLAAVLFDAVEAGNAALSLNGTATGPGGVAMGLRFQPASVTVQ